MYMLRGVFIAVWAISLSPIVNQKTPSPSAPKCQIEEKDEIRIVCTYTPSPRSSRGGSPDPGVAITRAVFSGLEPNEASNLHAELTFTNTGTKQISEARTVYLEIDDDAGSNYVRRVLPSVDLRSLLPGKSVTFTEELRIAGFPPGHYRIALWIPDPDPSRKFNAAANFLLSSSGVPDQATRLNILADFTVARPRPKLGP